MKQLVALSLSFLLVLGAVPADSATFLGTVTPHGKARLNDQFIPADTRVASGDRIATEENGQASLRFDTGEAIALGELSAVQVEARQELLAARFEQGVLIFRSQGRLTVEARGITIRAKEAAALAQVILRQDGRIEVGAFEGAVEVLGADRPLTVNPGYTATLAVADQKPVGAGAAGLSVATKVVIVVAVAAGVAAAIAIPLALRGPAVSPVRP